MTKTDLLREKFQHELAEENKNTFIRAFCSACLQNLYEGQSIFLEGFGILSSVIEKRTVSSEYAEKNIARQIKQQNIQFQKCSELTSLIKEKNVRIIEEKELAEAILSKLPLPLQLEWRLVKTREYLNGLILSIKHDCISLGSCKTVSEIGEFYALHNRQGYNLDDWYAGANIIFDSHSNREISCEDCRIFDKPVLQNSWELMTCLYGSALHIFSINICKELKKLGFDLDRSYFNESIDQENIQVAIFANKSAKHQQLIYCTDGLRNLALANGQPGNELIFQVHYDGDFRDSSKNSSYKLDDILLPNWPKSVLLMGWIMLQNSKTKSIRPGAGLSFNSKLCGELDNSKLTAVISTQFQQCRHGQQSPQGSFTFINLLGVTNEEFRLSENYSSEMLLVLLKSKRLDQVTKLCRPNLLVKTSFLDMTDNKASNTLFPANITTAEMGNTSANA